MSTGQGTLVGLLVMGAVIVTQAASLPGHHSLTNRPSAANTYDIDLEEPSTVTASPLLAPLTVVTTTSILTRAKRGYYDYSDPWGRDRVYGRGNRRQGRRRWDGRRRVKKPNYRRRGHKNYRGPDPGDQTPEESVGYVDTSVFDRSAAVKKTKGAFVSARSSGVAKIEVSGTDV